MPDETRVLVLVGHDYEDLELWYPALRLREAGVTVILAGEQAGASYRGKHGYPCQSEAAIDDVPPDQLAGVVLPGGWMPDKLRRNPRVLALVRTLAQSNRLVAAICHGPWIAISAGVVRGVRMTGSPGIRDDLVNAGALWEDAEVVVDGCFVTSRRPDDLPAFAAAILQQLSRGGGG